MGRLSTLLCCVMFATAVSAETQITENVIYGHKDGMALTYARALRRELERVDVDAVVAMGGTLNEDLEDHDTPVDLSNELRQLGVKVCTDVTDVLELVG